MLRFAGYWLLARLCMSAPFVLASTLEMGAHAEIIAAQPGITFAAPEASERGHANTGTEVTQALFSGCGESWTALTLGQGSASEFKLATNNTTAEFQGNECGRSLKINNRGRLINVESEWVIIRGKSVMSVQVHL